MAAPVMSVEEMLECLRREAEVRGPGWLQEQVVTVDAGPGTVDRPGPSYSGRSTLLHDGIRVPRAALDGGEYPCRPREDQGGDEKCPLVVADAAFPARGSSSVVQRVVQVVQEEQPSTSRSYAGKVSVRRESGSAAAGVTAPVVPGVAAALVWILGHSYAFWGAIREDVRPCGRQLGFSPELATVSTEDKMYACLQNKLIYFLGDSTARQWFEYLVKTLKEFKNFDLHRAGLYSKFFAANDKRNTLLFFKKHSHPFVTTRAYVVKDDSYMSDEIDHIEGGPHHVLVLSIGQHFRLFPIQLFIRRVFNVHRAVERLFIRSPDTKVIIRTENTREIRDAERLSDFHGYIQYLIVKEVFKDLPIATVDAWDMTTAFNTDNVHPPVTVVRNQIYMFLSYICS
ncbi:NXPE family member 1-like [Bufo gargarizans]|uniref:NXPE family member 1-like n=1 Tax=Bufo gargarizans TaxID=30331 RepID=UPI001CF31744|nr:NXPE family member 1-like [Bufo gargarizans]